MILSAICVIAFAGSASAQEMQTVTITKLSDKNYCNKAADEYINKQEGLTGEKARLARKSFYDGCIAGRSTSTKVISLN